MSEAAEEGHRHDADTAPGDEFGHEDIGAGLRGYLIGLALATLLTAASFLVLRTQLIWAPAIPVALLVFAIAQMGVHLVFFLHITTAPDNTNNVIALAFGVFIVFLQDSIGLTAAEVAVVGMCTALGGIAATPTAKEIAARLERGEG